MQYVIITPVFNEDQYIENTIKSVVSQTIKPIKWIIVDDNSIDNTYNFVKSYIKKYRWIELVKNENSSITKEVGAKVVRAFNYGYEHLNYDNYDFIVKLDGDLILPDNYFEVISKTFFSYPDVGICGGYCISYVNGNKRREKQATYHIRGAFKSIRKECWKDIDGFQEVLGWDGLDEMTAMYKGWKTMNVDLPVIHLRPTGKDYSNCAMAKKKGFNRYKNGGGVFLTLVRAIVRVKKRPYFLYSGYFLFGYLTALIKNEEKNVTPDLARFINRFHFRRLLRFKRY